MTSPPPNERREDDEHNPKEITATHRQEIPDLDFVVVKEFGDNDGELWMSYYVVVRMEEISRKSGDGYALGKHQTRVRILAFNLWI